MTALLAADSEFMSVVSLFIITSGLLSHLFYFYFLPKGFDIMIIMSLAMRKRSFWHVQTVKTQIRLIRVITVCILNLVYTKSVDAETGLVVSPVHT